MYYLSSVEYICIVLAFYQPRMVVNVQNVCIFMTVQCIIGHWANDCLFLVHKQPKPEENWMSRIPFF